MRDAKSFRNQEDSKINRYLQERAFGKMSRLFSDIVNITFRQIAATCPQFVSISHAVYLRALDTKTSD